IIMIMIALFHQYNDLLQYQQIEIDEYPF
ncbi:unnamed protein product, partial [Rotaria sp. Silwood1]